MQARQRMCVLRDEFGKPLPHSSSRVYRTEVNGARLAFSMNPMPLHSPIILFLHGGPGLACIPLTQRYNAALERNFRFINLDQRGCGLSYYPFKPEESVTIDSMLNDVLVFVRRLREEYPQAPITLIGHSWGSVLGLKFAQQYPQYIKRFIGVGQVVDMSASHRERSNPSSGLRSGWTRDQVDSESELADVLLHLQELQDVGFMRGLSNDIKRACSYLTSDAYGWRGLKGFLLGAKQSHDRLDHELNLVDFSKIHSFEVPVAFLEGRHDKHLPPDRVDEYASSLLSEHRVEWFEQSAHCPQWEEPGRFSNIVEKICEEDLI